MRSAVVCLLLFASAAFAQSATPIHVNPRGGDVVHIRGAAVLGSAQDVTLEPIVCTSLVVVNCGTDPLVVKANTLNRRTLTMLNVPADGTRARKRLRVYVASDAEFAVRVYDLDSGVQLSERQLAARFPTDGPGQPLGAVTLTADVYDAAPASGVTRLRVEVEQTWPPPPSPPWFWAFISVTDNVTQQVTIVAPR